MRTSVTILGGVLLVAVGYGLGTFHVFSPSTLMAQGGGNRGGDPQQGAVNLSDETKAKIKAASDALRAAMDALVDEGKYSSATKGVNAFAVLTGGGNAVQDLERGGAVVDPETYAALYADLATDNVAVDLGRDAEGRLTYKNKVVRMYNLSRVRALYGVRAELTGEELLPAAMGDVGKAKSKKKKPAPVDDVEGDEQ
ncbi:MAG: hypothetical protein ACKV0T_15395 [Planctomycetales bacterium]